MVVNVKKNKNHIYAVRFFASIFIITALMLFVYSKFNYIIVLCLGVGLGFPIITLLIYYEVWKISFFPNKICVVSLFFKRKEYSYAQIRDVVRGYSYTERFYIRITFDDGKSIQFRLEDENAQKAIKKIISHRPIREIG